MENFFARNLKFLRKRKNITQSELSVLVEKAHTTIGNWEKKISEPNIEELIKIVNYFNVSIDDVILKDLSNMGIVNNLRSVVAKEEPVAESNIRKLMESQQLNIETLQKLLAIKDEELNKLKLENIFLKQSRGH